LNSIVISEELNRINIKDKAFDGIWDMRMDKVMRFEGPYMSENELRQQRAMVENAIEQYRHLGGVPLRMQIDQDGYFLKAMTETEQFTGICSGKWFVIGNCVFTKKGDHVIDRIHLLYGELKEDGRIEGKELSIFNDKPVERFPTFNAEIETHFVGKYVGSSLRF
jgi:hypothetical protein